MKSNFRDYHGKSGRVGRSVLLIAIKKIIVFAALSSLWPSMNSCAYIIIIMHVSHHKVSLFHTSLCFKTHLNVIIIDVKNKELLLHSITVAKGSKKMKGDK